MSREKKRLIGATNGTSLKKRSGGTNAEWKHMQEAVFAKVWPKLIPIIGKTNINPFYDELLGPRFNPVLAIVLKIIFAGMPGAVFVTGLISMIKRKERSVLVLVSMALGLWFLIGGVWHLLGGD